MAQVLKGHVKIALSTMPVENPAAYEAELVRQLEEAQERYRRTIADARARFARRSCRHYSCSLFAMVGSDCCCQAHQHEVNEYDRQREVEEAIRKRAEEAQSEERAKMMAEERSGRDINEKLAQREALWAAEEEALWGDLSKEPQEDNQVEEAVASPILATGHQIKGSRLIVSMFEVGGEIRVDAFSRHDCCQHSLQVPQTAWADLDCGALEQLSDGKKAKLCHIILLALDLVGGISGEGAPSKLTLKPLRMAASVMEGRMLSATLKQQKRQQQKQKQRGEQRTKQRSTSRKGARSLRASRAPALPGVRGAARAKLGFR